MLDNGLVALDRWWLGHDLSWWFDKTMKRKLIENDELRLKCIIKVDFINDVIHDIVIFITCDKSISGTSQSRAEW
jgi:hypothetical protein